MHAHFEFFSVTEVLNLVQEYDLNMAEISDHSLHLDFPPRID